jgi:arginase
MRYSSQYFGERRRRRRESPLASVPACSVDQTPALDRPTTDALRSPRRSCRWIRPGLPCRGSGGHPPRLDRTTPRVPHRVRGWMEQPCEVPLRDLSAGNETMPCAGVEATGLSSAPVAGWELVGVPYTSRARPGGIATAIDVLRATGLAQRLRDVGVRDAGDMELEAPTGQRGPSGLLNEHALGRLVAVTREVVRAAHRRDQLPLLVGGDCPLLLGALAAIAEAERAHGLTMIDGHEDAWPPWLSETGEASDSELGIALGKIRDRLPSPLDKLTPLVDPKRVALLGPRDANAIDEGGATSVRDEVACFFNDTEIGASAVGHSMSAALDAIGEVAFWLHIDLDVLATEDFAAVDYPQPGGLRWDELDQLVTVALASPQCRGASVVIYNPDLDPDRAAAERVVDFVARSVGKATDAQPTSEAAANRPVF